MDPNPTDLDALVAVRTVVNDGERLLETGPADADDIGDQLTDSDDHLGGIKSKSQTDARPAWPLFAPTRPPPRTCRCVRTKDLRPV